MSFWNRYRVRPWELTRIWPRPVLAIPTVACCPEGVVGGAGEALAPPPPLPQAATARAISGAAAAPAGRVRGLLRFMMFPFVGATKRVGRPPRCSHRGDPPIDPPDFSNDDLRSRRAKRRSGVGRIIGAAWETTQVRYSSRRGEYATSTFSTKGTPIRCRGAPTKRGAGPGDPGRRGRRVGW